MITFFADSDLVTGRDIELGEDAAAHARARREEPGASVRLLDGRGAVGNGTLELVAKRRVVVRLAAVTSQPAPVPLEVLVPVADKDRMLLAAEKCAELQVTAWRPVLFERSRSVNPRGEGTRFREKVIARMRAALEQSGGAWMPRVHEEAELADAVDAPAMPLGRLLLDSSGTSIARHISRDGMALAIGPEGGITPAERSAFDRAGWSAGALGTTVLRFETAVIVAVGSVRAALFQEVGRGV